MKPDYKWKPHSKHQSAPATCERDLGGFHQTCGAHLQLVVTRNPIGALPYDDLVVIRCTAGHITDSQGVL